MTEHTELTAEQIDEIRDDLENACHSRAGHTHPKLAQLCQQAKSHVGAGGAVAWVRFCSDGTYEGPLMDSDSRMSAARRKCWTPLTIATSSPAQEAMPEEPPIDLLVAMQEELPDHRDTLGARILMKKVYRVVRAHCLALRGA